VAGTVHESLSALDRVLTGTEDGIALVGPGRRFAYANPVVCQTLGCSLDELRGRDFLASQPAPAHQAAGRLPGQVGQPGVPDADRITTARSE
jgi:PAS domain-containing protein